MKIKFIMDYTVRDESSKAYAEGDIEDMTVASAMHFINREAAVAYEESIETKNVSNGTVVKTTTRSRRKSATVVSEEVKADEDESAKE